MKSKVKLAKLPQVLTYPLLMRDDRDGETILLTDDHTGTVVVEGRSKYRDLGYFSDDWSDLTCLTADHWKVLPAGSKVILTA